ncbi:hypothetical protein G7019_03650 [Pseudomonas zeshuii]|nr:hypothetical protein [Pseudomonas zeshuii]QEU27556.1 hypothetical protein FOB45_05855 [Pseudomonas luteola]
MVQRSPATDAAALSLEGLAGQPLELITEAVVGGAAGHHGGAGAVAGCAVGHHEATISRTRPKIPSRNKRSGAAQSGSSQAAPADK